MALRKIVARLPPPVQNSLKRFIHMVRLIPYLGKGRYCPVCAKASRHFRPYGLPPRPEAQCVHCESLERHRLLWVFLQNTDIFDGQAKKMLHVAPEQSLESRIRNRVGDGYLTADLHNPEAMVKMDITNIEFSDQSFDVIYCSHVLEHVLDDRKAIAEFHRVLKKEGWAILLVPIGAEETFEDSSIVTPEDRLKFFGQEDHVRVYGMDYVDRLRSAGFHVKVATTEDLVSSENTIKMGLTNTGANGEIYYCTKLSFKS